MSERFENQVTAQDQSDPTGEKATQLALLYECWPGGPIVRDPKECRGVQRPWNLLPEIEMSEFSKT